jgi:diaminopimelate epimerase
MRFWKMHGAGNDFVLTTAREAGDADLGVLARRVCHRRFGIGADGLMVAAPSETADVQMIYYNSDGSRGEMCGNGIRCFSRMVWEQGLVARLPFVVETLAGPKTITLAGSGDQLRVRVAMGLPGPRAQDVPALVAGDRVWDHPLTVQGREYRLFAVRMGVPHCVIFCDAIDARRTESVGPELEVHPMFPARTNVNFVQVVGRDRLNVDTWERGCGHTLACGTGVCSSVWVAHQLGHVDREVTVTVPGGTVRVTLADDDLYMEGEARWICEGTYLG